MLFVIVCTEGAVSEPECLNALLDSIKGQAPLGGNKFVEVLPVPLGGNQGHVKLIERAEGQIERLRKDPESLLSITESGDEYDKWLVCDYDNMDESGVEFDKFKEAVAISGYTLIVNKPNFEYFVLCLIAGVDIANKTRHANYFKKINEHVGLLNIKNKSEKGFTDSMTIPPYSKKKYEARAFFSKLLQFNPELLQSLAEKAPNSSDFTDMPKLIRTLKSIYSTPSK